MTEPEPVSSLSANSFTPSPALASLTDSGNPVPATDPPLGPVTVSQRIDVLDVLRGFALIGIVMMNIEWFNRPIAALASFDFTLTGADHAAGWFVRLFSEGKFYKLFSLLFGMGFAIMLTRAQENGRPFRWVFVRRMLALLAFGLIHLVFFWGGDILHDYAIGGLLLLGFVSLLRLPRLQRFDNPRSNLRFSLVMMGLPFLVMALGGIGYGLTHDQSKLSKRWQENEQVETAAKVRVEQARTDGIDLLAKDSNADVTEKYIASAGFEAADRKTGSAIEPVVHSDSKSTAPTSGDDDDVDIDALSDEERVAYLTRKRAKSLARRDKAQDDERLAFSQPSYSEATAFRLGELPAHFKVAPGFAAFILLPIFIFGYWLIRTGRIQHSEQHREFFRALAWIGMGLGLPMTIAGLTVVGHPAGRHVVELRAAGGGMFMLGQYAMTAGYLGLVVCMMQSAQWRRLLTWTAPLGRMALTNYLMQSLILSTVFFGYGFGLYGQIGRMGQMGIAVAIIAFQWLFSLLWLKAFRIGPLEWIWRCITYWKWQPIR